MARLMMLDINKSHISIPPCRIKFEIKGVHLILFLIFAAGLLLSALTAYIVCYPFLGDTPFVFMPLAAGAAAWAVLCLRLCFTR